MKTTLRGDKIVIEVSKNELHLLQAALREISMGPYAIEDWEFSTLVGATKAEAKTLLEQFSNVIKGVG